ncbi:FAD binding domain-containing protein [Apiospora kogelbergensis]
MVGYVLSQFPYLDRSGISGYSFMNPIDGIEHKPKTDVWVGNFVLQDTDDVAKALAIWEPVLEHIRNAWPEAVIATPKATTAFKSHLDYFRVAHDKGYSGLNLYAGSRLLDATSLTADPSALGQAFKVDCICQYS